MLYQFVGGGGSSAAPVSVNARYTGSATTLPNGSLTITVYGTQTYDTHSAYNNTTGIYTVPISGKYEVTAAIGSSASYAASGIGDQLAITIFLNASQYSFQNEWAQTTLTTSWSVMMTDTLQCNAGDTITVQSIQNLDFLNKFLI